MKSQKFHILGLLALIILTPLQLEANPISWPKSEWPELKLEDKGTYKELCEYDVLCGELKDRQRNFKFPHQIILKIFWLQKERLASIAKKYGIHPLIPMAAMITEHSLNVGIEDQIQDNLKSLGLDMNGRLLGLKAVSYGYGQLYKEAAMNAEQIVARIEDRHPEDYEYVQKRIVSIEGAYEYVAALMLYYTEAYANADIDISHNPGILTTLYNIGNVDQKIRRTVEEGRTPEVNYFGWFALHNWKALEVVYNDDFSLVYVADLEQSLQESRNDGRLGNLIGSFMRDRVPTFSTTVEVPLRDNPPRCNIPRDDLISQGGSERRERAYLESRENSQLHPYTGEGSFDIYLQGFDCLGRTWGLLDFTESGRMGWLNLEAAGSVIEMTNRRRECEKTRVDSQCLGEIKELLDSSNDFLEYDENKHIVYVRLGHNSLFETNEMSWGSQEGRWSDRYSCDSPRIFNNYKVIIKK